MPDPVEETQQKIRRSLGLEFVRMEDDFDAVRDKRKAITEKLVAAAIDVKLVDPIQDDSGRLQVRDDTPVGVALMKAALGALSDIEKGAATAINLKLRHSEQEAAAAALHKDRMLVVLEATRPGRIQEQSFEPDALEHKFNELFDGEIKDFELKTNPNDISE